jgi:hypothetical protein
MRSVFYILVFAAAASFAEPDAQGQFQAMIGKEVVITSFSYLSTGPSPIDGMVTHKDGRVVFTGVLIGINDQRFVLRALPSGPKTCGDGYNCATELSVSAKEVDTIKLLHGR